MLFRSTNVGLLWNWKSTHDNGGFPAAKLKMVSERAASVCDPVDGVKDGIVDDPRRCNFDPGVLQCRAADRPDCLTLAQAAAVRNVYDGPRHPRNFDKIFAGLPKGTEATWDRFMGAVDPQRVEYWRQLVFNDPAWDFKTFDFDKDIAYAESKMAAISPEGVDMNAFRQRGGKLLMYHGWVDPIVPGEEAIRYFTVAQQRNPGDFARLYMVPGMGHCSNGLGSGGPAPDQFDALTALDQWFTSGQAPDKLIASHATKGTVDRTRPLCIYPQVAKWDGTGNIDKAESFTCKAP